MKSHQANAVDAEYLAGEINSYAAYLTALETAQKAYEDEQCRLAGLLQDSVDTGYNMVADGTSSMDFQVCFRAGTPIVMADDSTKEIEKIVLDDLVLARPHDNPTGPLRVCRVTRLYHNPPKPIWKATFDNGLTVEATLEHPFYVQDKGWVSLGDLKAGDECVNADGEKVILISKEFATEKEPVYNFEVEDAHTYFVGTSRKESVLVHNDCPLCNGSGKVYVDSGTSPSMDMGSVCPHVVFEKAYGIMQQNTKRFTPYASARRAFWPEKADKWGLVEKFDLNKAQFVREKPAKDQIKGVGAGEHYINGTGPNTEEYIGSYGMGPCVGVILYSPSLNVRAAFHFDPNMSNETGTINRYRWPEDTVAIIAGGDISAPSVQQLGWVIGVLNHNNIDIVGYFAGREIYCNRLGQFIYFPSSRYTPQEWAHEQGAE